MLAVLLEVTVSGSQSPIVHLGTFLCVIQQICQEYSECSGDMEGHGRPRGSPHWRSPCREREELR
jgi:hypothetical protein